jgi:anti-sigma factor RsiW
MLDAFVDNELEGSEKEQVVLHLSACDDCTRQVKEIEALKVSLSSLPRRQMKFDLADNFDEVLSRSSSAQSEPPGNVVPLRSKRKWLVASATAAAVVVIAIAGSIVLKGDPQQVAHSNVDDQSKMVAVKSNGSSAPNDSNSGVAQSSGKEHRSEDLAPTQQQEKIAAHPQQSNTNFTAVNKTAGAHLSVETERLAHGESTTAVAPNSETKEPLVAQESTKTIVPASQAIQSNRAASSELLALYEDDDGISSDIGVSTDEDGLYAIKL